MPYTIEMRDNNQHCVVKKDTGETVGCHPSHQEAEKHLAALEANIPDARAATYRRYGDMVQSKGDGRIGGYLVHYNGPDNRDLYETYFDNQTEYFIELGYPIKAERVLYNHGLEEGFRGLPIGVIDFVDQRDVGIWIEAQLHDRAEYERMLKEYRDRGRWEADDETIANKAALIRNTVGALVDSGYAALSSGSREHLVKFSEDGHAEEWPIIEASVTLTPGKAEGTEIKVIRSAFEQLQDLLHIQAPNTAREGIDPERATPVGDVDPNRMESVNGVRNMDMKEALIGIQQMVSEALAGMKPPDEEQAEMAMDEEEEEEIRQEAEEELEEEVRQMEKEDEEDEELRNLTLDKLAEMVFKKVEAKVAKHNEKKRKASDAIRRQMKEYQREQPARRAPGYVAPQNLPSGGAHISVSEPLRYVGHSGKELALGIKLIRAQIPEYLRHNATLGDLVQRGIISEDYVRSLGAKLASEVEGWKPRPDKISLEDYAAFRSVMPRVNGTPYRADELQATNITGQGLEWVELYYDTQMWERARDRTELFNLITSRGMEVETIPEGTNGMNVKLNTSSGTVYTMPEANNVDITGRAEIVAQLSNFGTGEVEATVKTHVLAHNVTYELAEDSIIRVLSWLPGEMEQTLAESLESTMYNGDTVTAANTNVNLIDGTPAGGLTTPDYIAWDGFRKEYLVTNTAFRKDAEGTLTIALFEEILELFPSSIKNRRNQMLFIFNSKTESLIRRLPELLTFGVAGQQSTIYSGNLPPLFGVDPYMSGFANQARSSDGKISVTAGNNTTGTITAVYAPYWKYGRKRAVNIEQDRRPRSQSTDFVATVRHVMKSRGAGAAAGAFNVAN